MEDIEHYDIPVYNFPYDVEEDDEDTIQDNIELRVRWPNSFSLQSTIAFLQGTQ
jgi:cell division control protein 11